MSEEVSGQVEMERELDLDLPALRRLDPRDRADFLDVLATAVDRERAKARAELEAKISHRWRLTRLLIRSVVLRAK